MLLLVAYKLGVRVHQPSHLFFCLMTPKTVATLRG